MPPSKLTGLLCALSLLTVSSAASAEALSRERRARLVEEMFDEEPSLASVRDVAMRHYELHPEELGRLRHRLRSKAGMPYFVVSERYQNNGTDRTLRVEAFDGVERNTTEDQVQASRNQLVGILSWNLPVGVMSDSEFQVYQLVLVQQQILSSINSWFYSRRILLTELLIDPPRDPRALTSLRLRVDGFTALLNLYTGGWYSRQLPEIPEELIGRPRRQGGGQ